MLILYRLITFVIGTVVLALMYIIWTHSDNITISLIVGVTLFIIIGIYFIIAAIFHHKKTTKDVTITLWLELPVNLVIRGLNGLL